LIKTGEQNAENFVTWESPAYGVKINYPSNWLKIEQGLKGKIFVMFKSPKEDSSDIVSESVGISIYPLANVQLEQFTYYEEKAAILPILANDYG
jgi:hypothetical protein